MPNRREHDHLVSKIVALGISKVKAESLVSRLSGSQVSDALSSTKAFREIIDIPSRSH
jgi:hypothetical protein